MTERGREKERETERESIVKKEYERGKREQNVPFLGSHWGQPGLVARAAVEEDVTGSTSSTLTSFWFPIASKISPIYNLSVTGN